MLVDLSQSRRQLPARSLYCEISMVGSAWLCGADHVHHAVPGAMDRIRARGQDGDADRFLVLLHRRRSPAPRLCALHSRSGLHPGTGVWSLCLCAQSLFRAARPARGGAGGLNADETNCHGQLLVLKVVPGRRYILEEDNIPRFRDKPRERVPSQSGDRLFKTCEIPV